MEHKFVGTHIIAQLYGVDSVILDDETFLENSLYKAVCASHAHCEGKLTKKFLPHGVTIIFLLSESHTSIHTYPETNSLFFDAFTCGTSCDPEIILKQFCQVLIPRKVNSKVMIRE